jgi:two-component system sensor histidine kinase PilS (NtrC family)
MSTAASPLPRPATQGYFASHWRSLDYFNLYRLTLAVALIFSGILFGQSELFREGAGERFQGIAYAYLVMAALFVLGIRARWPGFQLQLTAHITADIIFVMLLMSTSVRLADGLALLLVISIASGGLVGSGRLSLLYAAMASIALLLHHGFSILGGSQSLDSFFRIGMLCAGYFAIGWLAHALTQRALRSEKLAQQQADELALLNRINALAIENSPDGLLTVRGDGVVRHASPRALALLGISLPVKPGITRLEACSPELARLAQEVRPGATSNLSTPAAQLRVRCIPLATPDNSRVLVLEDLSQAEQAAQRLKLAALGRLTANIAHEIRNPLSAISHAAQLLREDTHDPAQTKLTSIIENNTRRLDRLVEEVLTLNRRDRLNPGDYDAAMLAALIDELRHTEEIPADAVIVSMPDTLRFQFDPDHLRQIVWNLLRNAWRFSRKQAGSLRFSARMLGDNSIQFDIEDDGPGLSAEHHSKLFEPFFTTDAQGTGLGLFLARELAEANHATLAYVPNAGGARFRLSLRGSE